MEQLLERRNAIQTSMHQQIHQQAQTQAQNQQAMIQQQQQAQQMMFNHQNGGQGQGQRPMPQQQNQQPFSHLQHQMQASLLPGQQLPQTPMGMSSQGMQQNLTQNQQQQLQANMDQQRIQQQNSGGMPVGPPQLSQQDTALVQELMNKMSGSQSEEDRNAMRLKLLSNMTPAMLSRYQTQGQDPLQVYYRSQALQQLKRIRMGQQMMSQQSQQGTPLVAPAIQPQRSVNPSPIPGQVHPSAPMGSNADFTSFMGNMEPTAAQQQQQGVIAEQAGQMVVPVSGGPRVSTPQPGVMAGQPSNLNPNMRAQQQQQMMAQQLQQQQRLHQQSQTQAARLNAQNKVQQMGLQGQIGGMGPGPVPPQQSPAMSTLNTPMRTPSQQMNHPESLQGNPPSANFGAPLDPRFMQGNQRQVGAVNAMGIAGFDPAMISHLSPEKQQQIMSLPQEQLQDFVNKWNAGRQAQAMAGHMQNGRQQMPMQGAPVGRPGQQVPQPGQFNPQAAANQFVAQNGGQRGPPPMVNGMNPAQQMAFQQQMARQAQMQRGIPMNHEPQQQQANQAMDNYPFPPGLLANANLPQGIPPEIKKWGQLKHWILQNAQGLSLPMPHTMEHIKQLQGLHYRNILTQRNKMQQQQQMQGGNMQIPGGVQAGNTIPPGMSAPVAPMGPNPMQMQMQNGMNGQIRQPTPQDIQNYRDHMGTKVANVNDNDIRALYIQNMQRQQLAQSQQQMTPQQQQQQQAQRQQMVQQLQLQRMQQANAQQNGQPQSQPHQIPQPQSKPAPTAPPIKNEAATPSVTNANVARASRPQQNIKNQPQNASPDQPAKSLKRASSNDDVVEVPNPNIPQARPASAQVQGQRKFPLAPAQVAALNPEQQKNYERMLQHHQASMAMRSAQIDPVKQERLRVIGKEESDNFRDGPVVPMDEANKKVTSATIMKILPPLISVGKILPKWFQETSDEATTREFFRLVS